MYLCLTLLPSALTSNALYKDLTNWEQLVTYSPQSPKLPKVFESLNESVAVALETRKPEPPIRAVVELDDQVRVVQGKPDPKSEISFVTK